MIYEKEQRGILAIIWKMHARASSVPLAPSHLHPAGCPALTLSLAGQKSPGNWDVGLLPFHLLRQAGVHQCYLEALSSSYFMMTSELK